MPGNAIACARIFFTFACLLSNELFKNVDMYYKELVWYKLERKLGENFAEIKRLSISYCKVEGQ